MSVSKRFGVAAGLAVLAGGLLVAVPASPAMAATQSCTYHHEVAGGYASADNYGYGGAGQCYRVQAKARIWYDSTYSSVVYGHVDAYYSRVDRGGNYAISEQGTAGQPVSSWSSWDGSVRSYNRTVTVS